METKQLVLADLIEDMCAEKNVVLQPLKFARDIMTKEVRTLTLDHTVNACIKVMEALRIRQLPLFLLTILINQRCPPASALKIFSCA